MVLNFIINLAFFVGIGLLIIGIAKKQSDRPQKIIEYRYIPRTFKEEQESPIRPSQIFGNMFNKPTVWVTDARLGDRGSSRRTYQYISQS